MEWHVVEWRKDDGRGGLEAQLNLLAAEGWTPATFIPLPTGAMVPCYRELLTAAEGEDPRGPSSRELLLSRRVG